MATVHDILIPVIKRLNANGVQSGLVMQSLNDTVDLLFEKLWFRDSDLATVKLDLRLPANRALVQLPDDFRGLKGRPFLEGEGCRLMPATEDVIIAAAASPGKPSHYHLAGEEIEVFPTPTEEYRIQGRYYAHPGQITDVALAMPFFDIFNRLCTEAIYKICEGGPGVATTAAFSEFLDDGIDRVLASRDHHAPIRRRVRDF
jgi:hypothetical protein